MKRKLSDKWEPYGDGEILKTVGGHFYARPFGGGGVNGYEWGFYMLGESFIDNRETPIDTLENAKARVEEFIESLQGML